MLTLPRAAGLALVAGLAACAVDEDGAEPEAPAAESTASLVTSGDTVRLRLRLAGDAAGEVVVAQAGSTPIATCSGSCTVPVPRDTGLELVALTPSQFAGWGGVCAGSDPVCHVALHSTATAGATFTRGPAEEWTLLFPDGIAVSADFDPSGDLVVGTTAGLRKLSAGGAPLWFQGAAPGPARADPNGDIFAMEGDVLVKVSGDDGVVLWTLDVGPGACGDPPLMAHAFETAPNGDVAIQHGSTLHVVSGAGVERWSATLPVFARCAVAINSEGIVHSGIEEPLSAETTDLARFTADGVQLPDSPRVAPQYWFAMAFDPQDFLLASSGGHSHVDVLRWSPDFQRQYQETIHLIVAGSVENGVAADATGHAAWAFEPDDSSDFNGVVAQWIDAAGAIESTITRPAVNSTLFPASGVQPHDVAADDGNFVLVGAYRGAGDEPVMGWVQAYRP